MARTLATADTVALPELLDFVRPRHRMVLTTFRADDSLQSSPVTGGVDAEGRIVVASYPQRRWAPLWPSMTGAALPSRDWSSTSGRSPVSIPIGTITARRWSNSESA